MDLNNTNKISTFDYLVLLPIMGLAFYIAFIPHINYPYPVHIDEWVHLAYSKALVGASSTTFSDPFWGKATLGVSANLEAGFHLLWGVFHQISGVSWLSIFRYFPGVILMITVLSVYILGRRQGFGWEAALFTCLIPTTVGILGPAFLVPVAMGLLFIPLSLFIVFNFKTGWSYLVLFLFACLLLIIHAPSAVCLVIVLIPYILLNLKGNFKHSLWITLALALPFLAPLPWIFDMLLPTAKELFTPQPVTEYVQLPRIIKTYGYLPVSLCLLGTFLLVLRGGQKKYSLVFGLLALLAMLATFFTFHRGVAIMYERGLMFMMLMMSIVAGVGLMAVKNLKLPERLGTRLKAPFISQNIGVFLCLALVGLTLAMTIPNRQDALYYHMIDNEDYKAFVWIEENLDDRYQKAILDPWKGTAFTAITGKNVYTKIHAYAQARDSEAYAFLEGGCSDTSFLRENGISIVYTRGSCDNPDLVEQEMKHVYVLKEEKSAED